MKKTFVVGAVLAVAIGAYSAQEFASTQSTGTHKCDASHVRMFTKPLCSFCRRAKELLFQKGVKFCEIDLTKEPHMRDRMINNTGRTTVPQVFIGDTHVGGWDDLSALESQGGVDPLLEKSRH